MVNGQAIPDVAFPMPGLTCFVALRRMPEGGAYVDMGAVGLTRGDVERALADHAQQYPSVENGFPVLGIAEVRMVLPDGGSERRSKIKDRGSKIKKTPSPSPSLIGRGGKT